ncbi:hypothetical protein LPW26_11985 [Rhodopseudomonas sp. HC1]|nr:hypothetical protein [Rhodopseudomonas infernalis]MCG6205362.1 hypothetical protein [Rhodopseudomonas infernalis]
MPDEIKGDKLEPDDFPVHAERTELKTQDGEKIAEAKSKKIAEDIAQRLNEQAHREEEDRWSA